MKKESTQEAMLACEKYELEAALVLLKLVVGGL